MKNKILYPRENRGHADHGWLNSYHTFSFAGYMNSDCMNFGVLRVLNDDTIAAGEGFGTHSHDNMEIISLPLSGSLKHSDSMGNGGIVKAGEIQAMSAGTGIRHSEFNPSSQEKVNFFQIWLLPDKRGYDPRYQQVTLAAIDRQNKWDQIASPNPYDKGVWIHQNAWLHLADLEQNYTLRYTLKDRNNGIFLMLIEGSAELGEDQLKARDAIGFSEEAEFRIRAKENSKILVL